MRRWPWRRDRTIHLDLTTGDEATRARREAEAHWAEVHEVRLAHEQLRRQNHFAEKMRHALGGTT